MLKLHRFVQAALAAIALVTVLAAPAQAQTATGFSDLNYWGSGTNHSALVISWNDGKTDSTLAWGFSWTGNATVADMLFALAHADPRLFARIDSATQFGPAIFGLGYDAAGDGTFSISGALDPDGNPTTPIFTNGIADLDTNPSSVQAPFSSENAEAANPFDHYSEGWFDNGFWELFSGSGTAYPATWTSSMSGIADTPLTNDGWFALSISNPDFSSNIPGPAMVAPVPEPAAIVLLVLGGFALLLRRKSGHA